MLLYLQMLETPEEKSLFEQIYLEYRGLMYHVAYEILHNDQDAEDAVHQAFVKIVENIKKIVGVKPIVGICLGHQLLALTLGGTTTKLKFGHRGCNHPVKDLERNMVHITSQNHGYVVDQLPKGVVATHVNINDGTIEGMKHTTLPIYSVQFHPEAAAGPKDSEYIFDRFMEYAL